MIWFTLGNISVEGTYTTHALNLTPRGLLLAAAAAAAASAAAASCTVPYRISRGDGYRIGGLPLSYSLPIVFNKCLQLDSSRPILAASSQLFSCRPAVSPRSFPALQLPAAGQLSQLSAVAAVILPVYSQDLVI